MAGRLNMDFFSGIEASRSRTYSVACTRNVAFKFSFIIWELPTENSVSWLSAKHSLDRGIGEGFLTC